jgi:hypothetical protein
MKNIQKHIGLLIFFGSLLLLTSCVEGKMQGKYVKDSSGNYYRLEWAVGACYKLQKLDKAELDSLMKK